MAYGRALRPSAHFHTLRHIDGNRRVGNRSSLLQGAIGRSDLRMATDRRELKRRESEGISIALLIQSLDPSPGMCRGRESEFPPTETVVFSVRNLNIRERRKERIPNREMRKSLLHQSRCNGTIERYFRIFQGVDNRASNHSTTAWCAWCIPCQFWRILRLPRQS